MVGLGIAGSGRVGRAFLARLAGAGMVAESFAAGSVAGDCAAKAAEAHCADSFALGLKTLILIPRDIAESEALLFEDQAFAKRAGSLERIVIAATLSPRYVRALRGRIADKIALIDAPYSGTMRAAEDGRLSFFLGGRKEDIAPVLPAIERLGRQAIRMGGFGTAMAAKVMNDFLAASSTAMTRLALDWAEAQGIDEAGLLEMTGGRLGGVALPGFEMVEFGASGHAADEPVTTLIRNVEDALDTALAGAHLTPPRAIEDMFRTMKSRALH